MTKKVEQCICIKFCQKLGHSCSETYDMIQKAFERIRQQTIHKLSGLSRSKRDERQLRVMNVQEDPPQAGTN
jgi:hypothetical protein